MEGFQRIKFRFKFRSSYIYNPNQKIEGLIIKYRGACIYTWVNVNLN